MQSTWSTASARSRSATGPFAARRGVGGGLEAIERQGLAGVEDLVLAAEVVIEVGGGEVGGDGDVAHAGGGKPHRAEDARGGRQDLGAARLGAASGAAALFRTAVRNSNHCSILRAPWRRRQAEPPGGRRDPIMALMRIGSASAAGSPATRARGAASGRRGQAAARAGDHRPGGGARAAAGRAGHRAQLRHGAGARSGAIRPRSATRITSCPWPGSSADAVRLGFITFTTSAAIVAWLAAHAERRRLEALTGRREIERLYQQLQSAFDRASEVEAVRRNEQLKAALLDALTHNLRTPLTAIKAAVTALIGTDSRTSSAGLSIESRRELLQVIDEESDRLNRFVEGLSAAERAGRRASGCRAAGADVERGDRRGRRARQGRDREAPRARRRAGWAAAGGRRRRGGRGSDLHAARQREQVRAGEHRDSRRRVVTDARQVTIQVADEGPGVPPALRERVFEKFYRVPGREPADPNRAGIGLGLSIARRLVEAQGGRMWIQAARPSGGTAVMMTLPGASTASPAADAAAVAQSSPAVPL